MTVKGQFVLFIARGVVSQIGVADILGGTPIAAAADGSTTVYYLANGTVTDQAPGNDNYYGTLVMNADGTFTFTLNNASGGPADRLSEGEQKVITLSPTVTDGQATTVGNGQIVITIVGTNDVPDLTITHDNAAMTGDVGGIFQDDKSVQTATGKLTIHDVDALDMKNGLEIKVENNTTHADGIDLASSTSDNTIKVSGLYGDLYVCLLYTSHSNLDRVTLVISTRSKRVLTAAP